MSGRGRNEECVTHVGLAPSHRALPVRASRVLLGSSVCPPPLAKACLIDHLTLIIFNEQKTQQEPWLPNGLKGAGAELSPGRVLSSQTPSGDCDSVSCC